MKAFLISLILFGISFGALFIFAVSLEGLPNPGSDRIPDHIVAQITADQTQAAFLYRFLGLLSPYRVATDPLPGAFFGAASWTILLSALVALLWSKFKNAEQGA